MRAATAWNVLDRAGVPGVTDVWCPPVQTGINVLIRMKQSYRGQAKQAANALWGSSAAHVRYKHVTVVDDDIDIHDYAAVDWAIAHRVNAGENDIVIMAEFGLVEAQGLHKVAGLIAIVLDERDERIPDLARQALKMITGQISELQTRISALETQVFAWHRSNPVSQRLATIPGIGPIIATAIAATVADAGVFRSGREFAAWLGLVPRQSSTGGKARLGGISKRGDSYLRRLLVNSAHTVLLCSKAAKADPWIVSLRGRKPRLVVAVALANKTARTAWAVMSRQETYRCSAVTA